VVSGRNNDNRRMGETSGETKRGILKNLIFTKNKIKLHTFLIIPK